MFWSELSHFYFNSVIFHEILLHVTFMKSMSNKQLVPVDVEKVKYLLNYIGKKASDDPTKKSYVELGWAQVAFYSYRMLLAKLARGGLDFRAILAITRLVEKVSYSDVIIPQPDEWFTN